MLTGNTGSCRWGLAAALQKQRPQETTAPWLCWSPAAVLPGASGPDSPDPALEDGLVSQPCLAVPVGDTHATGPFPSVAPPPSGATVLTVRCRCAHIFKKHSLFISVHRELRRNDEFGSSWALILKRAPNHLVYPRAVGRLTNLFYHRKLPDAIK